MVGAAGTVADDEKRLQPRHFLREARRIGRRDRQVRPDGPDGVGDRLPVGAVPVFEDYQNGQLSTPNLVGDILA